jgi:glycine betaine catabolism A
MVDAVMAADHNALSHPTPTLPSRWYTDAAHHAHELETIWYRDWIYVARSAEVANPKDFLTVTIGTQSIVLIRDEHGVLRAFHNTCRHRGAQLCAEGSGHLTGVGLSCPYHAWRYHLDGRLAKVPVSHGATQLEFANLGLYRVALEEWRGFVYVNLSPEPTEFAKAFAPHDEQFKRWPLERLVSGHRWTKRIHCNWKIFWENYNECLHCPSVHPTLIERVPIYQRGIMESRDDPNWRETQHHEDPLYRGGLNRGAASWTRDGQSLGHEFGLSAEERQLGYHYLTQVPGQYLVLHVDHVRCTRLLPRGVDQTELQIDWLFAPELLEDPTVDIANAVTFSQTVMQEDARVCEAVQRGLMAQPFSAGVLMPEEYDVYRFQQWVRARVAG